MEAKHSNRLALASKKAQTSVRERVNLLLSGAMKDGLKMPTPVTATQIFISTAYF